jgi:hypothetical protein
MRTFCCSLVLIGMCVQGHAQVIYGVNNYTQYHPGTLPIVISVPHGGSVSPASIPTRTCNSPTTVTDSRTIELGRQIDTALYNLTGCHPHLIICNLKRTKVDCNRNIADGACGNAQAETAWTEFQHFVDTAQWLAQSQFSGKAFYIDLHGHGKQPYRLELGYGLSGATYDNSDAVLNSSSTIAASSIEDLVATNVSGSTHAQLLRGANALGTMLANAGYPSVPSQQSPNTGGFPYFNGGYNTSTHTCIAPGSTVNGLQIECDSIVRSSYAQRKRFADSVAVALVNYLSIHMNMNLTSCGSFATKVSAKVFLDGPYDPATGLMGDGLRAAGIIPVSEPYSAMGYGQVGGGGETILPGVLNITGNNAMVDWVLLELRSSSNPASIVESRSALLQRDGGVVDVDGISPVGFSAAPGNYYVAVRHRNHLGCMTGTAITLGGTSTIVDLTSSSTLTYGTDARRPVAGAFPAHVLYSGDVNFNGQIKYTGTTNDRDPILVRIGGTVPTNTVSGYFREDVNLSGVVKYTGSENDRDPILVNVGGTVPTNTRSEQLP